MATLAVGATANTLTDMLLLRVPPAALLAMERFWSAKVEAWYEHGIKDDNILLLAFHPETAEVSCSTRSLLRFTWEIAKANTSSRTSVPTPEFAW